MSVKKIATLGVLLAIMLVFQLAKDFNVYITGSAVNLVLIIVTYYYGLSSGLLFSVISPLTSLILSSSPIQKAIPLVVVFIALGNMVLCFFVNLLKNKDTAFALFAASTAKALFMGITISMIILPVFSKGTTLPEAAINAAKITFSLTQLITAYIASAVSSIAIKTLNIKK